jgi:hypothetical protein
MRRQICTEDLCNALVEFGCAIGLDKECYVVGAQKCWSIFYALPKVSCFTGFDEVLSLLL